MIEYKNVALRYTEKDVLRCQFTIENGSSWFSWSSTGSVRRPWLRWLIVLEPTDGNIYMDGKRIKDYDEELRLSTGYVLQAIALFPT